MRFGPRRSPHEPLGVFRYRQAQYCWPWTWAFAPVLAAAILVLRLAHDRLWMGAMLAALLSGAALLVVALAGIFCALSARWAVLRTQPASHHGRWPWAGFAFGSAILVPAWAWSFYWVLLALTRQHIVYGRWDNVVALHAEPQRFLLSFTAHVAMLITIPVYWMAQASRQPLLPGPGDAFPLHDRANTDGDVHASRLHRHPRHIDHDR